MASFKQAPHPKIDYLRLGNPISIMVIGVWSFTISISNIRIISKQLGLHDPNAYFLQLYSSKIRSTSIGNNIRQQKNKTGLTLSPKTSLKPFFDKVLEN